MELKKNYNIKQLKNYYSKFNIFYPFQDYEVLKAVSKFRNKLKAFIKYPFKKNFCFYLVIDKNIPVLLVPTKRSRDNKFYVEMLGSENFDYCDALYNSNDEKLLKQAYGLVFDDLKKQGIKRFIVKYNSEDSITKKILSSFDYNYLEGAECVKVNFENSWDEFFSKLTKSTRQNIRTSYNRLVRDNYNLSFECCFCEGGTLNDLNYAKKLYKECFSVYLKRQTAKYSNNFIHKFKKIISYKYFHYASQCALIKSGFISVVRINNEIIAFMSGFVDKNKNAVEIPRLAMNDKYKFYSPGMLLLCETIKYFIADTKIRCLDLCRGTEKYKLDIGGELYNTHNFYINL